MKDLAILGEKEVDLKVLSLTPLKNGNFRVILSSGEELILNEDEVVKYRLVKGKELSFETLDEVKEKIYLYEAYQKALRYITTYYKCTSEVYDYLIKKNYSKDIASEVCDMLKNNGLLNDDMYLEAYVSKLIGDGNGRLMISYKVKEKKLLGEYVIDEEMYFNTLSKLITSKLRVLKDKKKERLYRYLSSKGYTTDDISRALKGVNLE